MTEELKPCPFCNSNEGVIKMVNPEPCPYYQVICKRCLAEGPLAMFEVSAILAWNDRVRNTAEKGDWVADREFWEYPQTKTPTPSGEKTSPDELYEYFVSFNYNDSKHSGSGSCIIKNLDEKNISADLIRKIRKSLEEEHGNVVILNVIKLEG